MIEIIEPGTRTVTECQYCGCRFSYEEEDIESSHYVFQDGKRSPEFLDDYVNCPQCSRRITLKQQNKEV